MINRPLAGNLNLRNKIYAGLAIFAILSVFVRIALVQVERGRTIVSFVSEWDKFGKPVVVKEIRAEDIPMYAKFTVISDSLKSASGFVTGDIKDKLKVGQEVYLTDKGGSCGAISRLGQELDMDTGMFPVEVEFNAPVTKPGSLSVIFARIQIMKKALVVPNNILDTSGGNRYLWRIQDGKAKRVLVKIGYSNGYGTVISEGLKPGDLVVFNGRGILSEDDAVRIVSDEVASRLIDIKGRRL
ncbi:MAG: hypothetical protein WC417_05250 [Candidatus Omnitrophota bacterium]|jgi:multidrug efflux pump subunit AcrA (membrane-fusion protein)